MKKSSIFGLLMALAVLVVFAGCDCDDGTDRRLKRLRNDLDACVEKYEKKEEPFFHSKKCNKIRDEIRRVNLAPYEPSGLCILNI
ncbi:MAG: hypothetical protein LBG67_00520 [Campylobacteraceae bacterium]|jgi:hypothetical protein|nr:hypothetical protein [Campylobacteraceae bacterium]